jgi:hypothetical protein
MFSQKLSTLIKNESNLRTNIKDMTLLLKKVDIFCRKPVKIAENDDHNVGLSSLSFGYKNLNGHESSSG